MVPSSFTVRMKELPNSLKNVSSTTGKLSGTEGHIHKMKDIYTKKPALLLKQLSRLNPELKSEKWSFIHKRKMDLRD